MSTKHTPGPWSLFIESGVVRPGIEAKSVSFSVVVWGADGDSEGVHGRTSDEAIANARLIATAPELLDACKAARALTPDGTHTASVLDAAIAKAVGHD